MERYATDLSLSFSFFVISLYGEVCVFLSPDLQNHARLQARACEGSNKCKTFFLLLNLLPPYSLFSYGNSVTYMNDGTSLESVRQIRRTDNLRSKNWETLETAKLNILLAGLVKHHKCFYSY